MHEINLGKTILDYLAGDRIPLTTYEDLRQALARLLVTELGYPAPLLKSKVPVCFPVDGQECCRTVDIAAHDNEGTPFLYLLFVPGQINSFARESLAAARLGPGGPVPLVAITDTRQAILLATATGNILGEGMHALPRRDHALHLAATNPAQPLAQDQILREQRILHAYSAFIKTCCNASDCMP